MTDLPYEYHQDQLGVKVGFLITGRDMAKSSIQVIGDRGLRHRIANNYIKRLRPNGPNHPALVAWMSLPPEWQRLLIERFGEPAKQIKQSWFEKHYQRDTIAFEHYLTYKLPDGHSLPDTTIEEYTINASVLNAAEKVYGNRYALRRSMRGQVIDIWGIVSSECNRFRDIHPHTLPMNASALRRKLREYKRNGYQALIHGNFCNNSARKVTSDVMTLLNSMFASQPQKPTATEVARQYDAFLAGYVEVINNETGELYRPDDFRKLSNTTITNYLAKWVNRSATHAMRSGNRQVYMAQYKPYHSLEQPKMAGSIISIDDRQPPFEYAPGKRVWFYNAIDLASEAITCWVYGTSKEGIIDDFYRQLVRNYTHWGMNLPAELECESSLNSRFRETLLKEGSMFQHVRIEANNARGKRIEAYYRPLRYGLEKKREGWIARPFALSEPNQAGGERVPMVPYDQIIEGCMHDIWVWNNTEHSTIKGKSRWDVFTSQQNPTLKPINWRGILPHIGHKTETSCNTGIIRLQKGEYILGDNGKIAFGNQLIRLLDTIEGKNIDIYWLDNSAGDVIRALVYLSGTDQYVCEAIAKPAYNRATVERTPEDMKAREEMSKYVASVQGFINHSRKSIDRVTVVDNRPEVFNTHFEMPGLRIVRPTFEPTTELPALPDEEEIIINTISTFNRPLNDRF